MMMVFWTLQFFMILGPFLRFMKIYARNMTFKVLDATLNHQMYVKIILSDLLEDFESIQT